MGVQKAREWQRPQGGDVNKGRKLVRTEQDDAGGDPEIHLLVVPGFGSGPNKTRTWTGNKYGRGLRQFLSRGL